MIGLRFSLESFLWHFRYIYDNNCSTTPRWNLFMGMSFSHIVLLLIVVLIVFGAGKLPSVMGDVAKGIKAFKDGLKESDFDTK